MWRKWIENKIPQVLGLRNNIYPPPTKPILCKKRAEKRRILVILDGFVGGGVNLNEYWFFLIENTLHTVYFDIKGVDILLNAI